MADGLFGVLVFLVALLCYLNTLKADFAYDDRFVDFVLYSTRKK